jgi:hypothetical protein
LWKWIAAVAVVICVALGVAYKLVIDFLHSVEFRETLAEKVSETIGTKSEFGEMQWSLLHLKNDGFTAQSEGAVQKVEAKNIELDVASDFLTSDTWTITDAVVQSASLDLDLTKEFTVIEPTIKSKSWLEKQLPEKAELSDLKVLRADARVQSEMGELLVSEARVELGKEDYGYSALVEKANLALPLPIVKTARLESMKLRSLNERVVVDFAEMAIMDSGRLELDGEVDYSGADLDYEVNGWLTGLRCADLVNEDWKQRLNGKVESKFTAQPDLNGELEVRGNVTIRDGVLTALPVLDTIAAYTAVRDFKTLRFSEFRCDYLRKGTLMRLSNIYLHCNGLMRIEGDFDLRDEMISGVFQVGLNPGTLGHIPGAEDKVFTPGKEGMSWTTVKVGGTLDNVTEDLSDRMIAAAGQRLFEMIGGEMMLKFGGGAVENLDVLKQLPNVGVGNSVQDASSSIIESSQELLESGELLTDPVQSGADIIQSGLGGLFRGDSRKKKKEEE